MDSSIKFVIRKIESFYGPWYPSHQELIPKRISDQIVESIIPYYQLHKFKWTNQEIEEFINDQNSKFN